MCLTRIETQRRKKTNEYFGLPFYFFGCWLFGPRFVGNSPTKEQGTSPIRCILPNDMFMARHVDRVVFIINSKLIGSCVAICLYRARLHSGRVLSLHN